MVMNLIKNAFKKNFIIILVSAIIYCIGTVIGFYEYMTSFNITFNSNYRRLVISSTSLNFISIANHNAFLIIQLIIGSALFGITTFSLLLYNGILFGIFLANSIECNANISKIFLLIAPHGIFEIPATIIAGAAGFKIPYEIIRYLAGKKDQVLTKEDIKEYLTLAIISIILIVIAAWIEANVTLKIAQAMLNQSKGI